MFELTKYISQHLYPEAHVVIKNGVRTVTPKHKNEEK
jgi:hypothetical protein